jgi:transitional endoplasmic reticulum ATPase
LFQDAEYEDPVPFITKAHFEEAMSRARRSVSESDIRKYDTFNQNMKAARGFDDFKFEDGAEGGKEGEGEDDLYGAP